VRTFAPMSNLFFAIIKIGVQRRGMPVFARVESGILRLCQKMLIRRRRSCVVTLAQFLLTAMLSFMNSLSSGSGFQLPFAYSIQPSWAT
jgi:hypothetical protein